jgi:MoxR-like ATPase
MTDFHETATALARRLEESVLRVIRGKPAEVRYALVALFAAGHLLIEDVPGVGKTMLAKAIAKSVRATFRRVQFTPDLLPGDITGVSVFNPKEVAFEFRPGPIFTNVLLADEINRATPRTQAALLEAMEERQVTADGTTRALDPFFFVVATQNPIEQQGTFPLPEAELDRFLVRISLGYPGLEVEADLIERHRLAHPIEALEPAISIDEVRKIQAAATEVHLSPAIRRYIVDLVERTRRHRDVLLGASPRGSFGLARAAQALALFEGERFVRPEHVKALAHAVLDHRVIVRPQARIAGSKPQDVVRDALLKTEVPVALP